MTTWSTPVLAGSRGALGWVQTVQYNTIIFSEVTSKLLFTIPTPYLILDILVDVNTVFNSSGTDLLDIGITGTAGHFMASQSLAVVGRFPLAAAKLVNLLNANYAGDVGIYGLYTPSVADQTTGSVRISIEYATPSAVGS